MQKGFLHHLKPRGVPGDAVSLCNVPATCQHVVSDVLKELLEDCVWA